MYAFNLSCIHFMQYTAFIYQMMEQGTKHVLEQAVTTLASVADCAEEKFTQYYDR